MTRRTLIILSGLPGTGKTTIARLLATALRATGQMPADMRDYGYRVAHRVAEDNLRLGHHAVADCVNAFDVTRRDWHAVAGRAGARALGVELSCSDPAIHQGRIDARRPDAPPDWNAIQARPYALWIHADIHLDTTMMSADTAVDRIC